MVYDKYELLELFGNFPKVIDEEVEIYRYHITDELGFTFILHISTYEDYAAVSLAYKDYETFIFNIGFRQVEKIEARLEKKFQGFTIYHENNQKVIVYFTPNFAIDFVENLDQ
jgi:hypothetical protein